MTMANNEYKSHAEWFIKTMNRFWSNVDKSGDCWLWTGDKSVSDTVSPLIYGRFATCYQGERKQYRAHRFSWMLAHGDIPGEKLVMHKCDVPLCVNPTHLQIGTHLENAHDRDAKGRCQQGTSHYAAKLTEVQVLDIYDNETDSNGVLGKRYGVHSTQILKIRRGVKWKRLLRREGRIPPTTGERTDE